MAIKKRKSFTLAEVLVVISVLGIIAMSTIPTLVGNYQANIYKKGFKKTFSTLQSGLILMKDERSTDTFVNWDPAPPISSSVSFRDDLASYNIFKIIRTANYDTANGYCWHPTASSDHEVTYLNGDPMADYGENPCFMTADGAMFKIEGWDPACSHTFGTTTGETFCFFIEVDVNGFKKPNRYGLDIFDFFVRKNGQLVPRGFNESTPGSSCWSGGNGHGCAYKVIMNIDY